MTEYFTGHSEGCDGKCGGGGTSSNMMDYCELHQQTHIQYHSRMPGPGRPPKLNCVCGDEHHNVELKEIVKKKQDWTITYFHYGCARCGSYWSEPEYPKN